MIPFWSCLFTFFLAGQAAPPSLDQLQAAAETRSDDESAWLALAEELNRQGKETAAIVAYEKCKSLPAAREALGRYTRMDNVMLAADYFRAAADGYGRDQAAANRCRREVVRLTGDVKLLQELLAGEVSEATAKELPGLVGKCGRPKSLVADLQRWADALPKLAGPVAALAECENNPTLLLSRLDRMQDPVLYAALARMQTANPERLISMIREFDAKRPARAEAMLAGVQTEPAAVAALLKVFTKPPSKESWAKDAERVLRLGIAGNCLDVAETTLKSWLPTHPENARHVYLALILLYEQTGQFDRSRQYGLRCLQEFRDAANVDFQFHLARALMHLHEEKDALAKARDVAGQFSSVQHRMLYVETLSWFAKHEEAQTEARSVLAAYPDEKSEKQIRLKLASIAEYRNDAMAAEGHLLRVLEISPKDIVAHNNLGYFLAEQNRRLTDAERICRFAIDNNDSPDEEATYRDSLAWVLFRQGRLIAAQEQIELALSLPGGKIDGVIWDHFGDILAARGKIDRAVVAWTHALARIERSRTHREDPRPMEIKRKLSKAKE